MDDLPELSPWHLLCNYVCLTPYVAPGKPVLCALATPHAPLSADAIGSLTKIIFKNLGVYVEACGPHSTRGAGVKLYRELGLTAEQVCEIGKGKNVTAFSAHYSTLRASKEAIKG